MTNGESNQPLYPHSLIRVFSIHVGFYGPKAFLCGKTDGTEPIHWPLHENSKVKNPQKQIFLLGLSWYWCIFPTPSLRPMGNEKICKRSKDSTRKEFAPQVAHFLLLEHTPGSNRFHIQERKLEVIKVVSLKTIMYSLSKKHLLQLRSTHGT